MPSSSGAPRPASRRLASLALALLLCALPALAADTYAVFVELRPPYAANRAAMRKLLEQEGHRSSAEGEREIVLALSAAQLKALFDANVARRKVAASSRPGMTEEAYLENATIPPRFAKYIRRVYFDPQRG